MMKKGRRRETSWLLPMRQTRYLLEKEAETLRNETETLRKEAESLRKETESLRKETETLKRQNKALSLIESSGLDALLSSATVSVTDEKDHPKDRLDLDLLAQKFLELGCEQVDIPFLFHALDLLSSPLEVGLDSVHENLPTVKLTLGLSRQAPTKLSSRSLRQAPLFRASAVRAPSKCFRQPAARLASRAYQASKR